MKKTYTTPAVQVSGGVVGETRSTPVGITESQGFRKVAGSVGFEL